MDEEDCNPRRGGPGYADVIAHVAYPYPPVVLERLVSVRRYPSQATDYRSVYRRITFERW